MKIKVAELNELGRIIEKISEEKTNIILAYKIARIIKILREEVKTIDENRTKIIEPYAEKDENGEFIIEDGIYQINKDFQVDLAKKLDAFFSTEIEIDLPMLKLEELNMIEMSPRDMEYLIKIIEE